MNAYDQLNKAQQRYTTAKARVIETPNRRNENAYQKAKRDLADARAAWRHARDEGTISPNGDTTAKPQSLKATAQKG